MSLIDFLQKVNTQINQLNQPYQPEQIPEIGSRHIENHFKHKEKTQAIPSFIVLIIALAITFGVYVAIEGVPNLEVYIQDIVNFLNEIEA